MHFFIDFIRQTVPRPGRDMPGYYKAALILSEVLLAVNFLLFFCLIPWKLNRWMMTPLLMTACLGAAIWIIDRYNVRLCVAAYTAIIVYWTVWFLYYFGWGYGGQHFLLPLLVMCFFNIYEPPWMKLVDFTGLILCRMILYAYTLSHDPIYALDRATGIMFQSINSVTLFIMLSLQFILFSSNIQATERKLRLDNQELFKEAGTDPLTQLPNRRAMVNTISLFMKEAPQEQFSVAIADIDFFKKVNDTYGHNCGDYTLKQLSSLFRQYARDNYRVCRWGGEEFCFFLPGKNLDDAGAVMFELCLAAKQMPLSFGGNDFNITITIGVEEYDFQSPMDMILERADQKLYRGKIGGRNQVVL